MYVLQCKQLLGLARESVENKKAGESLYVNPLQRH